jgi:protein-tyrosine-phosphatase
MRVLFVCKGNVGRSQMAEALFKKKFRNTHEVFSAGTKLSGPEQPISELMPGTKDVLDVMSEEGIDVSKVIRKQLTEKMVEESDKIVVILEDHEEVPEFLKVSSKMERWSIPDPKGTDLEFNRKVREAIKERIEKWVAV